MNPFLHLPGYQLAAVTVAEVINSSFITRASNEAPYHWNMIGDPRLIHGYSVYRIYDCQ